jgi:uncharacterized protein
MLAMRFEHEFTVDASPARAWAFLMDVPRMAGCIPGASDVNAVSENSYDATVVAKIGPISARFGCRIVMLAIDEAARTASVEVSGKDNKIGGGVKATMAMTLTGGTDGPSTVQIISEVDIMGKIGQYGHGMVAKRADAMLADFAACVRANLAAEA